MPEPVFDRQHRARAVVCVALLATIVLSILGPGTTGWAQAADVDVPGGHFYTQTGGGSGKGYAVTDTDGVAFWTAFQQLGGVEIAGYPVSQRFMHGGFVTQAMQKAVFQWRPESKSVAFVNVFDDLAAAGKDDWLLEVRQTPKATPFPAEAGKPFDEVAKIRQAALDARPAMRAIYLAAANPVLQYGLPTSQVTDMGNHYAIRLQRAVIQEWKQDVPWAKAGQATVANGGDIAKEAGLFPAEALGSADGVSPAAEIVPTRVATVPVTVTDSAPAASATSGTPVAQSVDNPPQTGTREKPDCKELYPMQLLAPTATPASLLVNPGTVGRVRPGYGAAPAVPTATPSVTRGLPNLGGSLKLPPPAAGPESCPEPISGIKAS